MGLDRNNHPVKVDTFPLQEDKLPDREVEDNYFQPTNIQKDTLLLVGDRTVAFEMGILVFVALHKPQMEDKNP